MNLLELIINSSNLLCNLFIRIINLLAPLLFCSSLLKIFSQNSFKKLRIILFHIIWITLLAVIISCYLFCPFLSVEESKIGIINFNIVHFMFYGDFTCSSSATKSRKWSTIRVLPVMCLQNRFSIIWLLMLGSACKRSKMFEYRSFSVGFISWTCFCNVWRAWLFVSSTSLASWRPLMPENRNTHKAIVNVPANKSQYYALEGEGEGCLGCHP